MSAPRTYEADVCIVGSGVAGMICAARLAERFGSILVLERGLRTSLPDSLARRARGEHPFAQTALSHTYAGRRQPGSYPISANTTENAVGGSTLRWWGHAPRLAPADFALASAYGVGVDWPISYEEIEPYYVRAEHELGIAGDADDSPWPRSGPYPQPAHPLSPHEQLLANELAAVGVTTRRMPQGRSSRPHDGRPACCASATCSRLCPTDAKYTALNTHVPRAERTGKVRILESMRANVLVPGDERIDALRAQDASGAEVEVRARLFVLAANGLENPRLLLTSALADDAFVASSHTGRHFMDHPNLVTVGHSDRELHRGYGPTPSGGVSYDLYDGPFRSERAAGLVELMNLPLEERPAADAVIAGLAGGLRGDRLQRATRRVHDTFELGFQMELLPDAGNRVALSTTDRDPFGWPVLETTFDAWPDYVARSAAHWRAIAERLGERLSARLSFRQRHESRHLMGTCRMGHAAADSVVDRNLRYHAYANLFVLGSSAFPTCGAANPTLLIAALSLRCADFLLASGAP